MLKMGMVGGGPGSMIGDVHRKTAEILGKAKLVCGAFSTDEAKNHNKGKELGLDEDRVYNNIDEMIAAESVLALGEKMDFLAIATPNHLHVEAARKALEAGVHVICDKPLGISLEEALELEKVVIKSNLKFGMTYSYRGYAALRQMALLIKEGGIGAIRKVMIDYTQGWLTKLIEKDGQKQAAWRTDPGYSGAGGTIADIGTHAFNLAEFIAGARVKELAAQVTALVAGRKIDDDANVLLRFEDNAVGTVTVSQACAGEENNLTVKAYGDKGGLIWEHARPSRLMLRLPGEERIIDVEEMDIEVSHIVEKLPPGHPASFVKGFINIYDDFIDSIATGKSGWYPGIVDGVRGMLFIEKAIGSNEQKAWVRL